MDRRFISVKAFGDAPEDGRFRGVLSTYGNIDEVGDICEPGCYDSSISKRGVKRTLLWQHNWNEPIGSFEVTSTENELSIEGSFNMDVSKGREGYALLKRGDINGLSIGFTIQDYEYDADGIRHLKTVDLWEGSLVTFPANTLATAEAKSMENIRKTVAGLPFMRKLTSEERAEAIADIEEILARYDSDANAEDMEAESDAEARDDDDEKQDDEGEDEMDNELAKARQFIIDIKEVKF